MRAWLKKMFAGASTITADILLALGATLVFLLVALLANKFFKGIYKKIHDWKDIKIHALKIQEYQILSAGHFTYILIKAAKLISLLTISVFFYIYIMVVLRILPWTRPVYNEIVTVITKSLMHVGTSILSYLPNIALLTLITLTAYYLNGFFYLIFTAVGKGRITVKGFYQDWAYPTYQIVRFFIIAFAFAVAFPYLPGSQSPAFRGISIFLGALFTLGSTSAISNVIAGIILTYMRPFKPGDRVKIADTVGDVLEKSLLVTRISTIKNIEVTIPNSLILTHHVLNYSTSSKEVGLIVNTSVTIGYNVDWRKVNELLISAARTTELISEEPPPFVLQLSLDNYSVKYELNAYTEHPMSMAQIYSDLHRNIQDVFAHAGVEIMSPAYTSYRDGATSTVPFIKKNPDEHIHNKPEEDEAC